MKIRMPETYYRVKKYLKHYNEISALYEEQRLKNAGRKVQYWNWWEDERNAYWLEKFMESRGLLKGTNKTIALCSVFGEREVLERISADVKIFFSGENLHHKRNAAYADYMLSGKKPFDFAMGFDEFKEDNYLRFPLWLVFLFEPNATEEDIRKRCEELNHPKVSDKARFCSLVARADWFGIRKQIYDGMSMIGKVDCPSEFMHNDDRLKEEFGDDKRAYLQQYRFNICPENTMAYGYVTEKLYEAIASACVPVYWGGKEWDIVNPGAVLYWKKDEGNKELLQKVQELNADEKKYREFAEQPRLMPNAAEYVIAQFDAIEQRLRKVIDDR